MSRPKFVVDRDEKYADYLKKNAHKGMYSLGRELGIPPYTVRRMMIRLGIPLKPQIGKTVDKSGYILVYQPEHPYSNDRGYVREHRLMVEQELGRYLEPDEVVHHKNGEKGDNRLENLQLYPRNGDHMREEWLGRKHTPETLEKMRESAKKRYSTPEGQAHLQHMNRQRLKKQEASNPKG